MKMKMNEMTKEMIKGILFLFWMPLTTLLILVVYDLFTKGF